MLRDGYEYGTIRNLSIMVPTKGIEIDPKAGPIEREEILRSVLAELKADMRLKNERRNFKGY